MYDEDLVVSVVADMADDPPRKDNSERERRSRGTPPRVVPEWCREAGERALAQDGYWEPETFASQMEAALSAFRRAAVEHDTVLSEQGGVPQGMGVEMGRLALCLCAYAGMLGLNLEEMMRVVPKANRRGASKAAKALKPAAPAQRTGSARQTGPARGSGSAHRVPRAARGMAARPRQLRLALGGARGGG